jgi:flagellar motor switch protein FliN/FliY
MKSTVTTDFIAFAAEDGGQGGSFDAGSLSKPAEGGEPSPLPGNMAAVMRIPVKVQAILGHATMPVAQLMRLGRGAIVTLDRRVGEPVDVVVNGQIIARGEVVVVDEHGSRFGITLTEIVSRELQPGVAG